jgi:hypothetical protein
MSEKVSAIDVRQRIGDMLNRVALRRDEFVIERKGGVRFWRRRWLQTRRNSPSFVASGHESSIATFIWFDRPTRSRRPVFEVVSVFSRTRR